MWRSGPRQHYNTKKRNTEIESVGCLIIVTGRFIDKEGNDNLARSFLLLI